MSTFDIVVVGASGFAGGLVADYLLTERAAPRVAVAGRDVRKLRERFPEADVLFIDLSDDESVQSVVSRTAVVLTTVGPYARYGEPLVAACAHSGTHYVDLTGETPWVRRMIDRYSAAAGSSGACLVHCAGFDSVPSDVGVLTARKACVEATGSEPEALRLVVGPMTGGFSGGTVASMLATIEDARRDPELRAMLRDRDLLCRSADGEAARSTAKPPTGDRSLPRRGRTHFDRLLGAWTIPFFMMMVNARVVRRSNMLAGYPLGADPDYREVFVRERGLRGAVSTAAARLGTALVMATLLFGPTRWALRRFVLPKPGEGPKAARDGTGSFSLLMHAFVGGECAALVRISSDRDPGYGATAVMISECAVLLAEGTSPAGFHTPVSAFGEALAPRLGEHGVHFAVESPISP